MKSGGENTGIIGVTSYAVLVNRSTFNVQASVSGIRAGRACGRTITFENTERNLSTSKAVKYNIFHQLNLLQLHRRKSCRQTSDLHLHRFFKSCTILSAKGLAEAGF